MEKLRKSILVGCVASILFCLFQEGPKNFRYLFLLPIAVGVITLLFRKTFDSLKQSIVFYIFLTQVIIRYLFLPPLMAFGDDFGNGSSSNNVESAIFFMVLEIFFAFLIFRLMAAKQKRAYQKRSVDFIPVKGSLLLYAVLFLVCGYILASGYFGKVNLIWKMEDFITERSQLETEQEENSSWAGILFNPFRTILVLLMISTVALSKLRESKKVFLYLLIIILPSLFIIGTSRLSILRLALALLVLISLLISRKHRRILIGTSMIGLIPIIVISSIGKFTSGEERATVESLSTASSINAYFAGPGNVALGYDSYQEHSPINHFNYISNDILHNSPGLSAFADYRLTTLRSFNRLIYGNFGSDSQIPPLSTYGLFHYGIMGSFFYVPFFICIALFAERIAYKERFIALRYVFLAISLNSSLVFMLNLGSLFFGITSNLLFLYVPFYLISKVQSLNNKNTIVRISR